MKTDVAIVGGGAAGLAAALCIPSHLQVAVFVKRRLPDCASAWAQGGIAAALAPDDQADSHAADTLQAGDGLCNKEAVHSIVADAPDAVRWLAKQGVAFNLQGEDGDAFSLGREGGHSARRIAHADDMTGSAVVSALAAQVARRDNIRIVERAIAVNLSADGGVCRGFYALLLQSGKIEAVNARAVLLASGGGGKVYLYATTPPDATGDGAAMAYRLGCPIANMEFVQFHPTCLYHPQAAAFLVTEAMRGEGARLMNAAGDYFLENSGHSELSSRDIVARAIDGDMKKSGADCVYLDLSSRPPRILAAEVSGDYAPMPRVGLAVRAHSGRARGALLLRRHSNRLARPRRNAGTLGGGRGRPHRNARRKSLGEQFAFGMHCHCAAGGGGNGGGIAAAKKSRCPHGTSGAFPRLRKM